MPKHYLKLVKLWHWVNPVIQKLNQGFQPIDILYHLMPKVFVILTIGLKPARKFNNISRNSVSNLNITPKPTETFNIEQSQY